MVIINWLSRAECQFGPIAIRMRREEVAGGGAGELCCGGGERQEVEEEEEGEGSADGEGSAFHRQCHVFLIFAFYFICAAFRPRGRCKRLKFDLCP